MQLLVTIDTEGDNQWDHGREVTVDNLAYIPRFQQLCEKYNIKPTYFVTSEVCENGFGREYLGGLIASGKGEIGGHLHSWTTPPYEQKPGFEYNDAQHAYASELPVEMMEAKIKNLTEQIGITFGRKPTSFRSGRYGFDENVANALAMNSYIVDSSVTPYTSWTNDPGLANGTGGPDFIDKGPFPYYYEFQSGQLLEIPITILPTIYPLNRSEAIAGHYFHHVNKSLFLRVLRKIMLRNQPLWLRPYAWMTSQLFQELLDEATRIKLPFLVMIFHSSELMPGCSIYRQDERSIELLYDQLEDFFKMVNQRKILSTSMTEAALNFRK